jgi:regulatory protein
LEEEYFDTLDKVAERHWATIMETNVNKKKKKFCDYLLRKGWESNLIYEKLKEFENSI